MGRRRRLQVPHPRAEAELARNPNALPAAHRVVRQATPLYVTVAFWLSVVGAVIAILILATAGEDTSSTGLYNP